MKLFAILLVVVVAIGVAAAIAFFRNRRSGRGAKSAMFVGKYTSLLETSSFVPCEHPDVRYWLVWSGNVDLAGELKKLGFDGLGTTAYLRFEGTLATGAPGGYGHMGQYSGQLVVTRLLNASRESLCG